MRHDRNSAGPKRPTNVSLDAALVNDARALGVNVSAACEAGLRQELKAAREAAWREENRDAITAYNASIEANGVPLAQYRQF
ncbi:MAG: type II toxin-antitoxin system CcdA family antitoxin [Janthinobacterium lividum]